MVYVVTHDIPFFSKNAISARDLFNGFQRFFGINEISIPSDAVCGNDPFTDLLSNRVRLETDVLLTELFDRD